MEEVKTKVEHGSRHGLSIDDDVSLVKVPSASAAILEVSSTSRDDTVGATNRTRRVAISGLSLYSLPLGFLKLIVRRTASRRLTCPSRLLAQVGAFESVHQRLISSSPHPNPHKRTHLRNRP